MIVQHAKYQPRSFRLIHMSAIMIIFCSINNANATAPQPVPEVVHAKIVASGIPGAGAITEVGAFLPGSPVNNRPAFAAFTQPGNVLEANRLLVASSSNFGAPLAREGEAPGAILSIDIRGEAFEVPAQFATSGGQAAALDGRVQIYTANSPAFVNGIKNPHAVTRELPAVSLPLGISINNGFGRPWFANAPLGSTGPGTITVEDANGEPFVGANREAGGVFFGDAGRSTAPTGRSLSSPALATTLLTRAPDGSGRSIFIAALADGSVVQINVADGADGLAPPETFTPLSEISPATAESAEPNAVTRVGMVFNWAPTLNLFITDPKKNRLVVLDLSNNGKIFSATQRDLRSPLLNLPVDIAPTTREVQAHNFAGNTVLGGGSDLYVVNRGNNSIVRMTLNGTVQAVRSVEADIPGFRLSGIAVSSDGQTLWLTATAPDRQGVVMQVPAFGASGATPELVANAMAAGATDITSMGAHIFSAAVTPEQGLGPLFNLPSCEGCHASPFRGGMGTSPAQMETLAGHVDADGQFTLINHGPASARSVAELGVPCPLPTGAPPIANVTSLRSAMTLRGNGLIDAITDQAILANQANQPATIQGKPNRLSDGRIGHFGWKANVATLIEFMGLGFRNEIGVTNPLALQDLAIGCGAASPVEPEIDGLPLQAVAAFINTLDPPPASEACLQSTGATTFEYIGCAGCHTPTLPGRGAQVQLYSDLLLHDMGTELADGFVQGSATGSEWRTMPLWRLAERQLFLHDGRAATVPEAIAAHGGQAAASRDAFFQGLNDADRAAVLEFLQCI